MCKAKLFVTLQFVSDSVIVFIQYTTPATCKCSYFCFANKDLSLFFV